MPKLASKSPEDKGFEHGMACAIGYLIRQGEPGLAQDLWLTLGLSSVPSHLPAYDSNPIRDAIKKGWCL